MTDTSTADPTGIPERGSDAYHELAALHGWCVCPDGIAYDNDGLCVFCAGSHPHDRSIMQPRRWPNGPLEEAAMATTTVLAAALTAAAAGTAVRWRRRGA